MKTKRKRGGPKPVTNSQPNKRLTQQDCDSAIFRLDRTCKLDSNDVEELVINNTVCARRTVNRYYLRLYKGVIYDPFHAGPIHSKQEVNVGSGSIWRPTDSTGY